ncbi:hypothetical protein E4U42_007533 [Claviceps africana]|uniref:RING-type E3 ubiquitin transferase n=1 Tax=Claviceps africana TaxID=83212 RepID=A0A8K0NK10_9HYPO|nr:hypothetical protein E4U42_007533 [Claviceps africana]
MSSSSTASPYPFAAAPDIVRAHQKDTYFTNYLSNTITDLHRRLFGARSTHALVPDLRSLASLIYFCLTTLPGNRTLGEEYCDLVQVEGSRRRLPGISKRAAYIGGTIILPYIFSRSLPHLRNGICDAMQRRLSKLASRGKQQSREFRLWHHMANHISSLTTAAPVQAITLALFYFNGTYYELTKRLLALRYVFSRTMPASSERGSYEVLGILLIVQLAVQGYLHIRSTVSSALCRDQPRTCTPTAFHISNVDVSVNRADTHSATGNLLPADAGTWGLHRSTVHLASTTHTPVSVQPSFDLSDAKLMAYIKGIQQRKCTLCLEELKDPSATQCGHIFCWKCIGDWAREKPECPLCRREAMVQHILPLRVM